MILDIVLGTLQHESQRRSQVAGITGWDIVVGDAVYSRRVGAQGRSPGWEHSSG
jgi:hypothetical protein